MKLLFDQHLSPRLVTALASLYPDSAHVMTLGLDTADDEVIWSYARENGFVIVSKDSDFYDRSVLRGFPPKVVWLRLGNCPTSEIDMMLRGYYREIVAFESDAGASFLILERGIS